jgi:hypothetical protein
VEFYELVMQSIARYPPRARLSSRTQGNAHTFTHPTATRVGKFILIPVLRVIPYLTSPRCSFLSSPLSSSNLISFSGWFSWLYSEHRR